MARPWAGSTSRECCAQGLGLRMTSSRQPGTAASISDLSVSSSIRSCLWSRCYLDERGRLPDAGIVRRFNIVGAEEGDGVLAGLGRVEMAGAGFAGKLLGVNLFLQRNEGVDEGFRSRRTTGYIDIDRDEAIYALENVVTLLERASGDGAGTHGDDVFGLGHLVIETDDLGRHLLGHGT